MPQAEACKEIHETEPRGHEPRSMSDRLDTFVYSHWEVLIKGTPLPDTYRELVAVLERRKIHSLS